MNVTQTQTEFYSFLMEKSSHLQAEAVMSRWLHSDYAVQCQTASDQAFRLAHRVSRLGRADFVAWFYEYMSDEYNVAEIDGYVEYGFISMFEQSEPLQLAFL